MYYGARRFGVPKSDQARTCSKQVPGLSHTQTIQPRTASPVTGLYAVGDTMLDDLLTTPEAAELLRTSTPALAAHRHRGTGPSFVKAGRRVLYRRSALEAWLRDVEAAA